ncbi:uncharacterized protein LOC129730608 [Wyeomyia smithii]|uniref:uncharacterized protein LOC129730608 n=1 Tax=Wyeomyia smithii TaxID=174621 RepID=UPI00246806DE|nr:uncharacterized protein LOC129730608 [Wyeomyia smithii]XP_055546044.1 uncharacterized protein LOC129730608 [Wyeomyia smithii]XP_055546045.1 uncharacterized protein LOC129730608 [Wyeomyia smithii]
MTYLAIKANPTWGHQKTNNSLVSRLQNLALIDAKTAYRLKTTTAQCPRIYGLPKVHKPNMPLRPVVSNIGAPSYMLSKYVGQIIQASIKSDFNIKDSFSFCSYINSIRLPEDYVLVSFDVTSLFTSIPTYMIPGIIINRWQDIKQNTDINLDLFLEIIDFCLNGSYFSYKGKFFRQIHGTAMGNPLSPTIADLVMESLLENVARKIDFPVPVLKKYVDDLILALPPDRVTVVLNIFNSFNNNIQFTIELEKDRKIPFLDMVLIRQTDQTIRTEWYSKPMASGRLLDFHSCHPLHLKMNTIANFIQRVRQFTTNSPKEAANITINELLRRNHYPAALRHRLLNGNIRNTERNTRNSSDDGGTVVYKPMLFVNDLTQRLSKALKAAFPNITLASRYGNTASRIFTNMKDTIPPEMRHNVIYRIPCNDCEASYVGLTTTQLKKRISSHRSTINEMERLRGKNDDDPSTQFDLERLKEKTALLYHSIEANHNFNLEKTKIIDQHTRKLALPILEVCHIVNTKHAVNKRSDVDNLSSMYAGVLHTLNKQIPTQNTHTPANETQ